ncbi:MAG: polyamine aminopropyltransferase [bacterium]|nr:polyamine aminopropyltransferase [bacterium]
MDMELWYTEKHTETTGITIKVTDCLLQEKSKYQQITILQTPHYGKILLLDGLVMLTERDEFVYHEMITHVPLLSHPNPQKVLIVGGGDGGSVREVLKHPEVEHIDLVEIDQMVIDKCREYFPTLTQGLSSPKVTIHIANGIQFVKNCRSDYDVIIVDSTDPIGPGEGLFTEAFYQDIHRALRDRGLLVAQSESPFVHENIISPMYRKLKNVFPVCKMYLAFIPTYPAGCWSFAWCSKGNLLSDRPDEKRYEKLQPKPRYYNPQVHRSSFSLPNFVEEMLPNGNSF